MKHAFQTGNFIAALATIAACDIAFGLTFQLQPLLMEQRGIPAWLIGTVVAMGPLGILLAGPFLTGTIARFGGKRVSLVSMLTIFFCLGAFTITEPLPWWLVLRFILGIAVGTLFTVSEMWMLTISDDSNRGRVMGIYTSVLSASFAVGPLILPYTGTLGPLPWIICMVCVAVAFVPLLFVGVQDVNKDEGHGKYGVVLHAAPLLFLCVVTATFFDSLMMSFFTIFAMRNGVPLAEASRALGFGIVVGVVFFYPLGMLADRWSKVGVIALCGLVTIAAALALMAFVKTPALLPLTIVMSCGGFGVYVVALAMIGDVFKGQDMVAASAVVAGMWGVGGVAGPPIAGRLIDMFGINTFGYVVVATYCLLLLILALGRGQMGLRPQAKQA